MRVRFLLIISLLFSFSLYAQNQSIWPTRSIVIQKDSFQLDTLLIVKGSVTVLSFTEGIDYRINYKVGAFINLKIPKGTWVSIAYLPVQFPIRQTLKHKDIGIIQQEFIIKQNPFQLQTARSGFDPIIKNEGLISTGSLMRGLSIGNSQNAMLNANLNLQLAGRINNDVDVLAAISDDNNPIQPEGNTQELQDFDQVFVQFSKKKNKLVVGDYLMAKPEGSYFLNYYKKSRGLLAQTQFDLKPKQTLQVGAQAAISRGRFVRNTINGLEGNQGPYRLSGPNGEVFIVLISGTEVVYLDGEKLTRGEQNDYTIDYNSGEIVFMPKRLITQYSRVIVEFQYSDRNYARTLFGFNTRWEAKKASVYMNYFSEQDNKNQSFQQNLTDSNKLLLSQVGDRLQDAKVLSEVRVVPFNSKKILYRKIDSLGHAGVYAHTIDPLSDSVFFEVRFAYVGTHQGNYVQGASSSNGRVFNWVSPIAGVPQGDFDPYVLLVAPNRKQLLSLGTQYRFATNHIVNVEVARSDFNKNLFSELDKSNDAGYALKIDSKNKFHLRDSNQSIQSTVNYEFTDAQFRYVERYRNVEFNRIWNRQLNNSSIDTGAQEHILDWRLAYVHKKMGSFYYQLGYYNKNFGSFIGLRHQLGAKLAYGKNSFNTNFEFLNAQQKQNSFQVAYGSQIQNGQFNYIREFKLLQIGATYVNEKSSFKNQKDSLLSGSFAYQQGEVFIKSKDTIGLNYQLNLRTRLDQLPVGNDFLNHTLAKEAKASLGYLQKNFNKLNLDISFRNFQVLDSAFLQLKPEQTLLSRVEYDYGFFKRFITANSYFQLGSGNELKRDFQFVEVPIGQGLYVWKDFNEDGAQQINEFQLASFADKNLANYIKVFLPTTTFIRVNSTQFSQTLSINSFSNRRLPGFLGFLNKFSDQAAMRLERKIGVGTQDLFSQVFKLNVKDSSLINLGSIFRNTLFFNRNNPRYGLDFTVNKQQSKTLLTNGFETRNRNEFNAGGRYSFNANWTINTNYNWGTRLYQSEFFTQNNYQYTFQEIKPKLSYQYLQKWRLGIDAQWLQSANLLELGGDASKVLEIGAELRYSFVKIGVLSFKYNHYQVNFKGNVNSPLAYDMLQGLSIGQNELWSLNLQQRIGQNLQINMSYEGRKSGLIPVIHTGKMEARYLF